MSRPSPNLIDDYVIVQPHRFPSLPLRIKSTLQPVAHHESYPSSEDEYECVSSPESIRSLNSTPRARSPSPATNTVDQSRDSDFEQCTPWNRQVSPACSKEPMSNGVSENQQPPQTPRPELKIRIPTASHSTHSYSFVPIPPALETPYVYTTPSEEGYPGTGVLCPTVEATQGLYAGRQTWISYPSNRNSTQDHHQCGHGQIDLTILDRLIDHACEVRLKTDMRTPASRDAILRYQMMKRLRDLPANHPVICKATIDSPIQSQSYQLRWTSSEPLKAYRDVLTDSEKLACWFLFLTHARHFSTKCLFEEFAEPVRDLQLTASLMADARKVAQSVQGLCLTNDNVDAILRDKELNCFTQMKVVANAKDARQIYDEVPRVSDSVGTTAGHGDYYIRIPGTFQPSSSPSFAQQYKQSDSDVQPAIHLRRDAIKHLLYESLADPMLPMPIKRRPVAAPPLTTLPSGMTMDHRALQDYQMQLMLLERQNKKRLLCGRPPAAESKANERAADCHNDKTQDADMTTNTTSTSTPSHGNLSHPGAQALADYPAQLKLVEKQEKQSRRLQTSRQKIEMAATSTLSNSNNTPARIPAPISPLSDYEFQLKLLEQQCKKRHSMVTEMDGEGAQRRNKISRTGAVPLKLETRDYVLLSRK